MAVERMERKRDEAKATPKPLERYMRLLEVIAGFPEGVSASAIAEMLELPKATTYRLIRSLAEVGMVEMPTPSSAVCRVGARLERLLFAGTDDGWLSALAYPFLHETANHLQEACFLARFTGRSVKSVEMVAPDNRLRAYILPGQDLPLNAAASAKAILAFQTEATIDAMLAQKMERYTSATKTDPNALRAELAEVRRTGLAYCLSEDVEGFGAIAAPIFVSDMVVQHSMAVTGTMSAVLERKKDAVEAALAQQTKRVARAIAEKLARA